jgi:hypothetical protein
VFVVEAEPSLIGRREARVCPNCLVAIRANEPFSLESLEIASLLVTIIDAKSGVPRDLIGE